MGGVVGNTTPYNTRAYTCAWVCEEGCKIARLQDSRGSSLPLNLLQHPVSFVHVVVAEKEDESGVDDLGSPA